MKNKFEEGFGEEFDVPLQNQPPKRQKNIFRQYQLPICGLAVLVILIIGLVAWQMLNSGQNTQMAAYTPPVQQLTPSSQPAMLSQPLPQTSAASMTEDSAIALHPVMPPEYVEKMSQTLEDIKLDIAGIKSCEGSASAVKSQDNGSANLVAMIQEMTKDLKKLTENKKQLTQALQASERKIDELTQDNSKLKANINISKITNDKPTKTDKKDKKNPLSANSSSPDLKAELKTWKVIGLSANRVVLTDKSGKIHNMGVGDILGNIKIQSVDLESGNIKTTAGSLTYGE